MGAAVEEIDTVAVGAAVGKMMTRSMTQSASGKFLLQG
jgi:hypothetical protein